MESKSGLRRVCVKEVELFLQWQTMTIERRNTTGFVEVFLFGWFLRHDLNVFQAGLNFLCSRG